MLQIGLKKILWLKKLKTLCHGHMLLIIGQQIAATFYEKELQKNESKRV